MSAHADIQHAIQSMRMATRGGEVQLVEVCQQVYSQLTREVLAIQPGARYVESIKVAGVNVYVGMKRSK